MSGALWRDANCLQISPLCMTANSQSWDGAGTGALRYRWSMPILVKLVRCAAMRAVSGELRWVPSILRSLLMKPQ